MFWSEPLDMGFALGQGAQCAGGLWLTLGHGAALLFLPDGDCGEGDEGDERDQEGPHRESDPESGARPRRRRIDDVLGAFLVGGRVPARRLGRLGLGDHDLCDDEGGRRGGFKGFSKGLGQGLVTLVATTVTATLRAGESISQGISGSTTALANLGKTKMELMSPKKVRVRPPRRIDVRNHIEIYDEDLAVVN